MDTLSTLAAWYAAIVASVGVGWQIARDIGERRRKASQALEVIEKPVGGYAKARLVVFHPSETGPAYELYIEVEGCDWSPRAIGSNWLESGLRNAVHRLEPRADGAIRSHVGFETANIGEGAYVVFEVREVGTARRVARRRIYIQ